MSLTKALLKRRKVAVMFTSWTSKTTFSGNEQIFTFQLETPISKEGSTTFDNLFTKVRNDIPKVVDATYLKITGADMDKFMSEFITEGDPEGDDFKVLGYEGDSLVLDVAKPDFSSITGEIKKPAELWLKTHLYKDTPRVSMDSPRMGG